MVEVAAPGQEPSVMRPEVRRLSRLELTVAELQRSCSFYVDALGFERADAEAGGGRVGLRLGGQELVLLQALSNAAPYPAPRLANDPWFQHFAIAVADMEAAYAHLRPHLREAISRDGPQRLPPSTGSVIAYKFRDPDGHPLELSFAPASAWAKAANAGGALFQGIDHTAVAAADLEASVAFYEALGLTRGPRLLNQGPEQDRLDGLDGVELAIAVLFTPEPGPHLELLHYRSPKPPPPRPIGDGEVAATRTVWTRARPSGEVSAGQLDPDGHRLGFE